MDYKEIFNRLWIDYNSINPSVNKINELFKAEGESVVNDHIAFRTFDIPGINIDVLATLFLEIGYKECGNYYFESKKLKAKHFENRADEFFPKVFISELLTDEFSSLVKEVAIKVADSIKKQAIPEKEIIYAKNVWNPLSFDLYEKLLTESEYAAWLYAYGFRANHFTILINYLKKYNTIEKLNQFLLDNGFLLNSSGGLIKGTKEQMLKQSSTLADVIEVKFVEGIKKIPCCYYEFAERFTDVNNNLFTGFIAKSADKIFESTNYRSQNK